MHEVELVPGNITFSMIRQVYLEPVRLNLSGAYKEKITASQKVVLDIVKEEKVVYGVNTGFGKLATQIISSDRLEELQQNLIISHATGTGPLLSDKIVRLIMVLKINALAQGFSGVSIELIDALLALLNAEIYPAIPAKGSVGASGDLAPLSHLASVLLGVGNARYHGELITADEALKIAKLKPFKLAPKEGLALCNGTQVSNALALAGLLEIQSVYRAAVLAGALSVDASKGSSKPFKPFIHEIRRQKGQITIAEEYLRLLKGSEIRESHKENCHKVQDPYCLRCMPQVMGACLDSINYVSLILENEANAVSDNPLVNSELNEVVSGGNFHAQPVGIWLFLK
jgi:histidine ammonia-lyase